MNRKDMISLYFFFSNFQLLICFSTHDVALCSQICSSVLDGTVTSVLMLFVLALLLLLHTR